MKRGLITLLILFLLISPTIISAQEDESTPKEQLSALRGGLENETENILKRGVNIPSQISFIKYIINGAQDHDTMITWERLILFFLITFVLFVLFLEILEFAAFETDWVKYTIALGVAVLAAISGVIYWLLNILFKLVDNFFYIAGGVLVLIIISIILRPIIRKMKNKRKLAKAKELGIKSGAALKGLSKTTETVAKSPSQ
jgi:cation transport ATPase